MSRRSCTSLTPLRTRGKDSSLLQKKGGATSRLRQTWQVARLFADATTASSSTTAAGLTDQQLEAPLSYEKNCLGRGLAEEASIPNRNGHAVDIGAQAVE